MFGEDVDPFDPPRVIRAGRGQHPDLPVLELDPGSQPAGVIDATTPVAPDDRDRYSEPVCDVPAAAE